jgi:hypothetical protein
VGLPAALLLQNRDATVTVVHSRTPNAREVCAQADIVIAACGCTEMVKGDWIKEGAAVIDVGINAVDVCLSPLTTYCQGTHCKQPLAQTCAMCCAHDVCNCATAVRSGLLGSAECSCFAFPEGCQGKRRRRERTMRIMTWCRMPPRRGGIGWLAMSTSKKRQRRQLSSLLCLAASGQ